MDPGSSLNRLRGTLQKARGPNPFWMPREAWEVEGGPGVWEAKGISKGAKRIRYEKESLFKGNDPKPCTPEMLHGFGSEDELFARQWI